MNLQFKARSLSILVPMRRGDACMARQPMLFDALDHAAT